MPFGLDDVLVGVAINLVSSALWDLAHDPLYEKGFQPSERGSAAYAQAIETAVGELAPTLANVPKNDRRAVADFIGSDDVRRLVLQLYRTRITEPTASLATLRDGLVEMWHARHGDRSPAIDLDRALDALVGGCDVVLAGAIKGESVAAHEAMSAARHSLVIERLAGIERQVALLASDRHAAGSSEGGRHGLAGAADEIELHLRAVVTARQGGRHGLAGAADEFELHLRAAVIARHGRLQTSAFQGGHQVRIDDLYVAPPFEIAPRTQPTLYEQLARETFRVVVLGAPGAGKSSLAQKLCVDLARSSTTISGGLQPTGVLLRLREITDRNLRDSVDRLLTNSYQLAVEPDILEYLLEAGRLALIFDGLDELVTADDRRRARDDLEAFASAYPQAPIIVTSRIVGYEYAPLDEQRYRLAYLSEYTDAQVAEYVRRWFSLEHEQDPARAEMLAADFLRESESVPDLRTNPLLLQLLCTLYRREGHIARFRAGVYEACSRMLFNAWDLQKGIGPDLRRFRPAIDFLAWRMLSDPALAGGVNHHTATTEIAKYLHQRHHSEYDDAVASAAALLEFSTQRAWVFTDIGIDAAGESLYHFTHRTFLEFFAAEHVVSTSNDDEIAATMLNRLLVGDETVPGLALHLYGDRYEQGHRSLLTALVKRAATPVEHNAVQAFRDRIADEPDGWILVGP